MAAKLAPAADFIVKTVSSDSSKAPQLFSPPRNDSNAPPGMTIYVKVDLKIDNRVKQTAIFIPIGFVKGPDVDLVLFLHGFQQNDDMAISNYLQEGYGRLREGLNASGQNIVLVAPTLGPQSEAGVLTQAGGLDDFLVQSLSAIRAHGGSGWPDTLSVRNLVIACHSGGGARAREIAGQKNDALDCLREHWGFDSLNSHNDVPFWKPWALAHRQSRLLLFYLDNGTPVASRCEELGGLGLSNLIAKVSSAPDHMHVPVTHWTDCLKAAPFLEQKPQQVAVSDEREPIPVNRRTPMARKPKAVPTKRAGKSRMSAAV